MILYTYYNIELSFHHNSVVRCSRCGRFSLIDCNIIAVAAPNRFLALRNMDVNADHHRPKTSPVYSLTFASETGQMMDIQISRR